MRPTTWFDINHKVLPALQPRQRSSRAACRPRDPSDGIQLAFGSACVWGDGAWGLGSTCLVMSQIADTDRLRPSQHEACGAKMRYGVSLGATPLYGPFTKPLARKRFPCDPLGFPALILLNNWLGNRVIILLYKSLPLHCPCCATWPESADKSTEKEASAAESESGDPKKHLRSSPRLPTRHRKRRHYLRSVYIVPVMLPDLRPQDQDDGILRRGPQRDP